MKFAVIGDIHSNIFALEAVMDDIKKRDVDFILSTGDLVGYMAFPNEVISKVREERIIAIKGNHDLLIANSHAITEEKISEMPEAEIQKNASAHYTNFIITEENRRYLKNLPEKLSLECGGKRILLVHGSPRKIDEYMYEDKGKLAQEFSSIEADIIISGHTHIPYYLEIEEKYFINAGSVGKPKHGNSKSTYVIVSVLEGKVSGEIVEVSYKVEEMVKEIQENSRISDQLIPMLLQGF